MICPRSKPVDVIATRDANGELALWDKRATPRVASCKLGAYWRTDSDNEVLDCGPEAKRAIGGTFCGIKKGGMKRLRVTTTVEEVAQ